MMITEMMISEVADQLGLDQVQIRRQNMYKEGDKTPFDMPIIDWFIPEIFETILKESNYDQRRQSINSFNAANLWKKRGLSIIPNKFSIAFGLKHMNQGGALVHIYIDGSVLLHYGGIEMGQGLNTKMIQVAAETLKIPEDCIFIAETSTNTVINTQPTAASASSDIYGMAVFDACQILLKRLEPYRAKEPKATLKEWATAAYLDRICLSANGFYATPDIDYNPVTNKGCLYPYSTTGVCVSEVELDVLTGEHTILQTDILMDIGYSLNNAIDIGQIEGGFIQGFSF
jgi:xanthine dehydrogenase/oxidase